MLPWKKLPSLDSANIVSFAKKLIRSASASASGTSGSKKDKSSSSLSASGEPRTPTLPGIPSTLPEIHGPPQEEQSEQLIGDALEKAKSSA